MAVVAVGRRVPERGPDDVRAVAFGLVEEQRKLENEVTALRLRKDSMPPAEYDKQLEKLVTELALKTRAVREHEGKK